MRGNRINSCRMCLGVLAWVVGLASCSVWAQDTSEDSRRQGSIASQLHLAQRLRARSEGKTLASALDNNRSEWESLSPDERNKLRNDALAFLRENPQSQRLLLERYQKVIAMSAQRQAKYRHMAKWVDAVRRSLTPAQRQELLLMTPMERAKALIARRQELQRVGELQPETTISAPSAPTSMPANQ